jgi:hypothetical protein
MEKLRLFVVGQTSSDPDQWSPWFDRAIVIARDEEEAISLSGLNCDRVAEILLDRPMVLESVESHADEFTL